MRICQMCAWIKIIFFGFESICMQLVHTYIHTGHSEYNSNFLLEEVCIFNDIKKEVAHGRSDFSSFVDGTFNVECDFMVVTTFEQISQRQIRKKNFHRQ